MQRSPSLPGEASFVIYIVHWEGERWNLWISWLEGEKLAVTEVEKRSWEDLQSPELLGFLLLLMTGTKTVMKIPTKNI